MSPPSADAVFHPTTERAAALDMLRGVAVLGILLMNITAFGLPNAAYANPTVAGGAAGASFAAWATTTVLFEGTMRGLFSLLFGAGIVLLTERMEQAGAGLETADIYFRRMMWLLAFGLIHWTLLLWWGEILFGYAICGLLLFPLRKLRARTHLIVVAVLLVGAVALTAVDHARAVDEHGAASAAEAARASGAPLTAEQAAAIEAWNERAGEYAPSREAVAEATSWRRGGYWNAVVEQLPSSYAAQWVMLPYFAVFDYIAFMLIGMALLRLGVLTGNRPPRLYVTMLVVGYGVGLPLNLYELRLEIDSGYAVLAHTRGLITYQVSRLAMVAGHLGLLLLVIHGGWLRAAQRRLAAVGQMALSNYVAQTLICTALFYGFGFGLFGRLDRHELYYVVAAIWLAELIWSPVWLRRYRFGPLEWAWRSLTYWRRQPMRHALAPSTGPEARLI